MLDQLAEQSPHGYRVGAVVVRDDVVPAPVGFRAQRWETASGHHGHKHDEHRQPGNWIAEATDRCAERLTFFIRVLPGVESGGTAL
ncbi:hypothetical protein [Streptomyces sp. NPDC058418]|uniref:hypothetical protein n=1 Tax=Streptomyces sp. NPDC058418 TaxID=3346488 RepID=UPI00365612AB